MSFASWLCAVLLKGRKAPAKPIAEAPTGDGKIYPSNSENDLRMHIAAHDPQFPAKRDAAVAAILAAIDFVAQEHGLTKKPKSWAKNGPLGTVSIHLQRSRYGFDCTINLGFQPIDPLSRGEMQQDAIPTGPWAETGFIPLGCFYPQGLAGLDRAGTLVYLDVLHDDETLRQPMSVLSNVALPWLLAHLTKPNAQNKPFQG